MIMLQKLNRLLLSSCDFFGSNMLWNITLKRKLEMASSI
jgi:hypothetical protein